MVVRNGKVLTPRGFELLDLRVAEGRIVEISGNLDDDANVLDAGGMWVLPGVVDSHVHFNEPGREHWEGFATGAAALAAGGGTSFIDMPLNAAPPTIDRESFEAKKRAGEVSSVLDFALWGGLIPGNANRLPELAECGVVGFKAFLIDSGTADFPGVDRATLREGMKIAADLRLPVAVHAEDPEIIAAKTQEIRAAGGRDARAWFDSRPIESEVRAVEMAIETARDTGCALHVVHLSAPVAVDLVVDARREGLDITCEACPHHLLMSEQAMLEHGAVAKCAPPLRADAVRAELWNLLLRGKIDCVGSDHSPAPPEMKMGDDLFEMWGGIMGAQHGFVALLDAVLDAAPDRLPEIWEKLSRVPAARFGIGDRKGRLEPGCDADFILVRREEPREIAADELLYRHKTSPYVGRSLRTRVVKTFRRGEEVGLQRNGGRFLSRG